MAVAGARAIRILTPIWFIQGRYGNAPMALKVFHLRRILLVALAKTLLACPRVRFTTGARLTVSFETVFWEQPGSANGRPIWASENGYILYHKQAGLWDIGGARWIVSNALGNSEGYAMLDSWALSPVDAPLVSPDSVWQVHDGKAWTTDTEARFICDDATSIDDSFWLEFDGMPHLTGAYVRTGTVRQGGRHVFEQRQPWTQDTHAVFLYFVDVVELGGTGRWYISPTLGSEVAVWGFHEGEEFGPLDLFPLVSGRVSDWHIANGSEWITSKARATVGERRPAANGGNNGWPAPAPKARAMGANLRSVPTFGDSGWWSALAAQRNSKVELRGERAVRLRNGVPMPRVGCGTDGLGTEEPSACLRAGSRLIDTAMIYRNEAAVAAALRESGGRSNVFVVSKIWHTQLGFNATLGAVGAHLHKLGTSYLDLLLVHWPRCYPEYEWMGCNSSHSGGTWQQSWRAFERLYAEGRLRAIGVSNFDHTLMWEALVQQRPAVIPHVVQNWFDPLWTDDSVRDLAAKYGVKYTGYSPLRNTLSQRHITSSLADYYRQAEEVASRIGAAIGRSAVQVILRWMLQRDVAVIPRTSSVVHQAENLDLFEWQLDEAQMRELNELAWAHGSEL